MGSWSYTIMGGDGPLDAEGEILEFIGFDSQDGDRFHEDHLPEVRALLDRVTPAKWEAFFQEHGDAGSEGYAADRKRVAVVLILACGARLPQALADQAIEICKDELAWGRIEEREAYLNQFMDAIRAYDGTPTELPSEGLLEKLFADR